jgi:hypothetical protein
VTALSPRHLRWLARGLLAAMVLAVLAPSVSRVLMAGRTAGDWVQVCTAQGMTWVQLDDRQDLANADDSLAMHDLCGHCVLTADRFAPLMPTLPAWHPPVGGIARSASLGRAGVASPAMPPLARGPPEHLI